jgi:hypothetical protein
MGQNRSRAVSALTCSAASASWALVLPVLVTPPAAMAAPLTAGVAESTVELSR